MTLKGKLFAGLLAGVASFGFTLQTEASRHIEDQVSHTVVSVQPEAAEAQTEGRTVQKMENGEGDLAATRSASRAKPFRTVSHTMHQWQVESRDEGGTLIFSDSPEYVAHDGILYQDTVTGDARVLYYHLNSQHTNKKVAVVLEAVEDGFTTVAITRGGYGLPSDDYLAVGKAAQMMYYDGQTQGHHYMMKGSQRLLDQSMDKIELAPGQLVAGTYDFHTNHAVKVSVIMYPADADPFTFLKTARVQPKDEMRLRGTFKNMDRVLTGTRAYDPDKDGIVYIPLADNIHDLYRTGIDATDGSSVTDFGNYGINYWIEMPTVARGGAVKYFLCPLGGVYAGAMRVSVNGGRADMMQTPFGRTYFGDATPPESDTVQKAREAGLWILTKDAELADLGSYDDSDNVKFEFSPPGASTLPVSLILMPSN